MQQKGKRRFEKHLRNAVYGFATGDAMGIPYAYRSRGSFRAEGMTGGGTHHRASGTWSCHTALMIATWDSIKRKGDIDTEDMMSAYRECLERGKYTADGRPYGYGKTTATAIRRGSGLRRGSSNGNGSLTRILSLAFLQDVTDEEIGIVSGLTHAHPLSQEACTVYVRIAKELIARRKIMDAVRSAVRGREKFQKLTRIAGIPENSIGSSGFVMDVLEAAIRAVAITDNYRDCILAAVNSGGDTAAVAALAGGLAGILYGFEGIPEEWIKTLRNKKLIEDCLYPFPGTYEFAVFWKEMYINHDRVPGGCFEEWIGDGLWSLGFEMDGGKSLERACPKTGAFLNTEVWEKIVNRLEPSVLGNTIFTKWHYWNHSMMEAMTEADYEWFVIGFSRLAELALQGAERDS